MWAVEKLAVNQIQIDSGIDRLPDFFSGIERAMIGLGEEE
jgi:hypothetical protein